MDLIDFARACGITIDALPPIGVWKRYPTEDKPRSDNGAVKNMGDHGFVQNHATMLKPDLWQQGKDAPSMTPRDQAELQRQVAKSEADRQVRAEKAAAKAGWILKQCQLAGHPYLAAKGFPDEQGNVLRRESDGLLLLCIPMFRGGNVAGLQMIDPDGQKKFLPGQRSAGSEFVMDSKGPHLLCEGYATALSVRAACMAAKVRYTIHACFSAHGVKVISERLATLPHAIVADHDESGTGERYPKEAGIPYWLAPTVGLDFNDWSRKAGVFAASQAMRSLISSLPKAA